MVSQGEWHFCNPVFLQGDSGCYYCPFSLKRHLVCEGSQEDVVLFVDNNIGKDSYFG